MKPFEFECEHGRYRICGDKVEILRALDNGQSVYVRIDQGDPDRINPAVSPKKQTLRQKIERHLKRIIHRLSAAIHQGVTS